MLLLLAVVFVVTARLPAGPTRFQTPFALTVGDQPIDLTFNGKGDLVADNMFPWVGDFDGDGKPDLLVGQHTYLPGPGQSKEGRLRIYRNLASGGMPLLAAPVWFDERVPTGRIPSG